MYVGVVVCMRIGLFPFQMEKKEKRIFRSLGINFKNFGA